mgnify:FL=1|tara:strand:- start:119 stop:553 length:435 start_codon:yes stop_codon:yes gene_type:complete
MEWDELVGTKIAALDAAVELDAELQLSVEEYLSIEVQSKNLSARAKLLREKITDALPLRDGDEQIVKTALGDVHIEGKSSFTCSSVKMRDIVLREYNDADVPDFVKTKYSVTRIAFELLDTETQHKFYEAVTYKQGQHKITGSY